MQRVFQTKKEGRIDLTLPDALSDLLTRKTGYALAGAFGFLAGAVFFAFGFLALAALAL